MRENSTVRAVRNFWIFSHAVTFALLLCLIAQSAIGAQAGSAAELAADRSAPSAAAASPSAEGSKNASSSNPSEKNTQAAKTSVCDETVSGGKQLSLEELTIFNGDDSSANEERKKDIAKRVFDETGLVKPRPMSTKEKDRLRKAFDEGSASKYSVQELLDAGVFKFKPIVNLHPKCSSSEDDKSVRLRDGSALDIDNASWGKKSIPAKIVYGVMHSTEDGDAGASKTIDYWNNDCSAGKRSSSTPFVVDRNDDIYVTADFESRWQRHCSSKLTGIPGVVNWNSVGVEITHSTEKQLDYTNEQMLNVARLWTYILQRAQIPDSKIYTHAELQGHLPKDHVSFRTDPEGFDWARFGKDMNELRKMSGLKPPVDTDLAEGSGKTVPQKAIEDAFFDTQPRS